MSTPVIQFFGRDGGTWVKPAGAVRVDILTVGTPARSRVNSLDAADTPETFQVMTGKDGGYTLIITHFADGQAGELDPAAALVIATLRAMGDDAYQQVRDAMRDWDEADYTGETAETCVCGGKIRFGTCRDCGSVTIATGRTSG